MSFLAIFRSRRMLVLFLFGFSSGLPLYLTGQTLQAWLTSANVPLAEIAAFSTVGLAYTLKFTWAPLLDRYALPFLGRRRGWVMVTQCALVAAIVVMGFVDPLEQPGLLFVLAVIVAALSASQDVVLDAYNADLLSEAERAAGGAIYIIGYRVAMLVTGTLAFALADYIPWNVIYPVIASMLLIGIVGTLIAEEPAAPDRPAATIIEAVYLPFVELFRRLGAWGAIGVLGFVALYKFGDSFAQTLLITFLKRGSGFDWLEIAAINKFVGFAGIFVGGLAAGSLVARFGLRNMLLAFGVLQAVTNLLYALLAAVGPSYALFGAAVLSDNLTGAMGTAAFVAFLMSVCSPAVSATQFALLTSLSSLGQRVFGPFADDVVSYFDPRGFDHLIAMHATFLEKVQPRLPDLSWYVNYKPSLMTLSIDRVVTGYDWSQFFVVTALMAIPGLILAVIVARKV